MPRAAHTALTIASITAPVALYKTTDEPKMPSWDTAGPSGGILRLPTPDIDPEPVDEDPLAEFTAPEAATAVEERPYFVEEGTGERVYPGDERRGVRRDDGTFVDLTDQLASIQRAEQLEEMEVIRFVRVESVPREFVQGSYFLAPDGPLAPRLLRILWRALRATSRVAVVRWTKNTRQALGVLTPHRSGSWVVLEVAWPDTWRKPPDDALSFSDVDVTEQEVEAAAALVDTMSSSLDETLDGVEDSLRSKRWELRAAAESGAVDGVRLPEPVERIFLRRPVDADIAELIRERA